jgi:lipopolysaccharide assembly protein A
MGPAVKERAPQMRAVCFILLLVVLGAIAIFALQNANNVTVKYLDQSASVSLPLLIGAVYVLGMVSGWTVLGLLKRSLQRVTEGPHGRG